MTPTTSRRLSGAHDGFIGGLRTARELAEDASACECSVARVSGWSVGDHLEHLLLADRAIVDWLTALRDGEVEEVRKGGPNLMGHVILTTGRIPRGRGKAPDFTRPQGLSSDRLRPAFLEVADDVEGFESRAPHPRRIHRHPAAPGAGPLHGDPLASVRRPPPRAPRADRAGHPSGLMMEAR